MGELSAAPANQSSARVAERKRAWRSRIRASRRARVASSDTDALGVDRQREQLGMMLADGLVEGVGPLLTQLAGAGETVALFQSLPTEPPTDQLIRMLRQRGVRVILPHLLADKDLDWVDVEHLGLDPPPVLGPAAIGEAPLVIVPALAVDHAGGRLGQGGGSYDRALSRVRPEALVVAVVFDDELCQEPVPTEPHDLRVDAVLRPHSGWMKLPCEAAEKEQ